MSTANALLREDGVEALRVEDSPNEPDPPVAATGAFHLPDFSRERQLFAVTSRSAGRLNAASISPEEVQSLLAERQSLLDKKFAGELTRNENNRLEYVRWSLDRIEDAQTGEILDRLEGYLTQYENLLANIQDLKAQLDERLPRKR